MAPHRLPDVKCSYPLRNPYKVWVNVGGVKRIFGIHTLENLIHYGLDYRATPENPGTYGAGWARAYRSPEDELPAGPGILPKTLRSGMADVFPKLHHRGFLVLHPDALKWRPTRGEITSASMAHWYQSVLRHGAWELTPEAEHVLRGAKAWLEPQPMFNPDGGVPLYSLTGAQDLPYPKIPDETVTAILAVVDNLGAKGRVINNLGLGAPTPEPCLSGPHLSLSCEAKSGAYWLKQWDRAESHILGAVWKILDPGSI